ncbi:hypothetical protein D8M19_10650, partial [Corynebacterium pseudodiphtheriticum]
MGEPSRGAGVGPGGVAGWVRCRARAGEGWGSWAEVVVVSEGRSVWSQEARRIGGVCGEFGWWRGGGGGRDCWRVVVMRSGDHREFRQDVVAIARKGQMPI